MNGKHTACRHLQFRKFHKDRNALVLLIHRGPDAFCPAGSPPVVRHSVVLPWCTQAHWFLFKASMIHLPCIILFETCCGKNAEATETWSYFPIQKRFSSLCHTHSRVVGSARQAVTIKTGVWWVHVWDFILLAFWFLHLQNLVKIKGVPWCFL
jgi:hypothetical protein